VEVDPYFEIFAAAAKSSTDVFLNPKRPKTGIAAFRINAFSAEQIPNVEAY
jgi:hypothetical protein